MILDYLKHPHFFPCVLLFLYVCSSIRWFAAGNIGQGIYWIAAFFITFSVTFLMK